MKKRKANVITTKRRSASVFQMKKLSTRVIIRLALLTVAWLSLVLVLIGRTAEITPYTIFVIVASGIIVFVPIYKKYIKNDQR